MLRDPFKHLAWDDFRLVKAVAEARSLPAAALVLAIDHSTVFRRLRQIEAALGTGLFVRHRSGYVATAAGEEMVALAVRLEEDITAFTRKVAGREVSPSGDLRITTNDTLLIHLLTPIFVRFRRRYPEVRLDIVLSNQALNLSKRDADVAIRASTRPPETLVGRKVAAIAWALYGRGPEETSAHFADLASTRDWVSFGDDLSGLKTAKALRERVPPERIVYRVNTVLGLSEAVEEGAGLGYLPCFIADARPRLVRLAPPAPDLVDDLWLLTHPDLRQQPRVRVFLDFVAREIAHVRPALAGQAGREEASEPDLPIGSDGADS